MGILFAVIVIYYTQLKIMKKNISIIIIIKYFQSIKHKSVYVINYFMQSSKKISRYKENISITLKIYLFYIVKVCF